MLYIICQKLARILHYDVRQIILTSGMARWDGWNGLAVPKAMKPEIRI